MFILGICLTLAALHAAEPAKPNIIYIMADDLGYNDLSCQGATKVTTPGIDRLAKEGVRFTDAHTPDGKLKPGAPPGQLYDLAADPGETTNLYSDHPEIVARLSQLYGGLVKKNRSRP
ncbi:MAG: hypothetical protein D4R65_15395 [Verrucomicrobiaceae bacterium]|nr:MAG: hypothetical protein D4R65_15395 [Verrucomicrobiaceae bacterium]